MYSFPTYTIFDEFNQSLLLVVCVWQGVGEVGMVEGREGCGGGG